MKSDAEWLAGLKVGALVALSSRDGYTLTKLTGVTRTQLRIRGEKYRRDTGSRIGGDSWYSATIVMPTPEILDTVKRRRLVREIRAATEGISTLTPEQISTETWEQIRKAVQPLIDLKSKAP